MEAHEIFLALKSVCPAVAVVFDEHAKRWKVLLPKLRTRSVFDHEKCASGDTPEEALAEAWFWLTHNPSDRDSPELAGRIVGPAEQERVIVPWGETQEAWMRWTGFMWKPEHIQGRH